MTKKKNKLPIYILSSAAVLLVLVIMGSKMGWFGEGNITKVSVDSVLEKTIFEQVSASGKIQPEYEAKLSSEVSGEIIELTIREGDLVRKGQVLCRIKPDILQSGYDRAAAMLNQQKANLGATQQVLKQQEANFANMEAMYRRSQELYNKKVISTAEMDKAQADYASAKATLASQQQQVLSARYSIDQSQAQVKEALDNLSRTTIYAPSDGIISLLSVELGERVVGTAQMAGTEIMRIANMASMEVNVEVNENDINRVKVGNESLIEVDAFQGRKFKGMVTEIASSSLNIAAGASTAEQVTNFNVKVRIDTSSYADLFLPENRLVSPFKPGLSATVQIHTKSGKGLVVPIQAVTIRNEGPSQEGDSTASADAMKEYVFVLSGDQVKQVPVVSGIQDDAYIILSSGVKKGDMVVTRPFNAVSKVLKDGSKVKKVSAAELN